MRVGAGSGRDIVQFPPQLGLLRHSRGFLIVPPGAMERYRLPDSGVGALFTTRLYCSSWPLRGMAWLTFVALYSYGRCLLLFCVCAFSGSKNFCYRHFTPKNRKCSRAVSEAATHEPVDRSELIGQLLSLVDPAVGEEAPMGRE